MARAGSAWLSRTMVLVTFGGMLLGATTVAGASGVPAATANQEINSIKEAQDLLGLVPEDHRIWCSREDPETFADAAFKDAIVIVGCENPAKNVDKVIYVRYDSAKAMTARYAGTVPAGLPAPDGTAGSCPSVGAWHFSDGTAAGSDACFVTTNRDGSKTAKMIWTADESYILGYALNLDGDGAAVKQWWNASAGPLQDAEKVAGLADPSASARKAVGKHLVKQAPKSATNCKLRDASVTTYTTDSAEWAWLPWLGAEVICDTPAKGSIYYAQVTPDNAHDFWLAFHEMLTDEAYGPKHPAECDDTTPLVRKGDEVGEIVCWYHHTTLWAAWYDTTTGVVAGASAPNLSPKAFLQYLKQNKLT